jgi:hypothetical protein
MFKGASGDIVENKADLVALRSSPSQGRLTKVLRKYFAFFFLSPETGANGRVGYISEQKIDAFVGVVNVLLAAAFLFGAIHNLDYVRDERKTLGLVTGYMTAFAMTMWLLTDARRAGTFGACAAYAAVVVVFVSGNWAVKKNAVVRLAEEERELSFKPMMWNRCYGFCENDKSGPMVMSPMQESGLCPELQMIAALLAGFLATASGKGTVVPCLYFRSFVI